MGSTDFESDSKTIRNNELFYEYYFSKVTGELNQTLINNGKPAILISRLIDLHDKIFDTFVDNPLIF